MKRILLHDEATGCGMADTAKNYLGAAESELDGIQYEIGLREEGNGRFRGLLRCLACATTQPTLKLKQTVEEAVLLAKQELADHHESHHHAGHGFTSSVVATTLAMQSA